LRKINPNEKNTKNTINAIPLPLKAVLPGLGQPQYAIGKARIVPRKKPENINQNFISFEIFLILSKENAPAKLDIYNDYLLQ
jgi:hypothetical protein